MDVFPFPISDPRNPDGELGLYANPNLGAQLFLSGLTGPGTPAARTAGSVAPKNPNGTVEYSYRRPRLNVRSFVAFKSSWKKYEVFHCFASKVDSVTAWTSETGVLLRKA